MSNNLNTDKKIWALEYQKSQSCVNQEGKQFKHLR